MRPILVQKFGGSSVATPEKLRRVAELVVAQKHRGYGVVVVVSAMGDTTDELLELVKHVSKNPDRRELDMLLSTGERIAMSLLALAIRELGEEAVSLTGSQSGIITTASHSNARIIEVRPFRVEDELDAGRIVIVAGYQGVSYRRDITTLGRGGSDTTAVALAAALGAEACEIYSDVAGVFTADPRVVEDAQKLPSLGYEEMQELATQGARVLNAAAVEFAKEKGIAIYARKTGSGDAGTVVRRDVPSPPSGVRGIAHETRVGLIASASATRPAVEGWLERMEALALKPKQISSVSLPGDTLSFSAVLSLSDVHAEDELRALSERAFGSGCYRSDLGAVSLVGEGITRQMEVLLRGLSLLRSGELVVQAVSTSSFRISFLLFEADVLAAVRRLHAGFALERPEVEARVE